MSLGGDEYALRNGGYTAVVTEVDHAFTGLCADPDGRVRARVVGDDGRGAECEWDPGILPWVQVHTAEWTLRAVTPWAGRRRAPAGTRPGGEAVLPRGPAR